MEKILYTKPAKITTLKVVFVSVVLVVIALLFFLWGTNIFSDNTHVVSSESVPVITVVIDAGHGGIDGGAQVNGVLEKDLNLEIALKLREFLSLYNVRCVLTRDSDILLADPDASSRKASDLKNRVKVAKESENPIFLSVHMNKFPEEKYSGLQVFYSKNNPESEALALKVQSNVAEKFQKDNTRSVKEAGSNIFVLDRLECPAVLIECGFMSNPSELEKLSKEEYQNELAFIIALSVIDFLSL